MIALPFFATCVILRSLPSLVGKGNALKVETAVSMTIQNQWYYVKDNERCGPVDSVQLKQLADAGEIQRDSLVWRAGMADWAEAEQVKGLFPEPEQPSQPITSQPVTGKVTPASQSAPAVASFMEKESAETPAAEESPVEATPVGAQPSEAMQPVTQPTSAREIHPVGILLDVLHAKVPRSFVDASTQLFTQIGFWAVLFYVMLLFAGSLVAAFQLQTFRFIGFEMGACILVLALQYPATRMLESLKGWRCQVAGPRIFFDTVVVLAILAGVGLLISLTVEALKLGMYPMIFSSIAAFIVLIHLATVAISLPCREELSEEGGRSVADEAKALFGGLLEIILRTVPVVFGVGVSLFSLELLFSMIALRSTDESPIFTATAGYTTGGMLVCLLLPAAAYLISVLLRFFGRFFLSRM